MRTYSRALILAVLVSHSGQANVINSNTTGAAYVLGIPAGTNSALLGASASNETVSKVFTNITNGRNGDSKSLQTQRMHAAMQNMVSNSLAGFFVSKSDAGTSAADSATIREIASETAELSQISADQFPNAVLEGVKLVTIIMTQGAMSAESASATLAALPNGQKAQLALAFAKGSQIDMVTAVATAVHGWNAFITQQIKLNPGAFEAGKTPAAWGKVAGYLSKITKSMKIAQR